MKTRSWALGVAVAIIAYSPAIADNVNLPGHAISDKEATAQAQTVFIGQLVSLHPMNAANGEYAGSVVYASRPSNGIRTPYVTSQKNSSVRVGAIPSDLSVPMTMTVSANEKVPTVGKEYVFYAKDNTHPGASGYEALKVVSTADHGEGVSAF